MKKALKVAAKALLILLILVLTIPFFIPFESSGTKDYRQAAPGQGDFIRVAGVDVYFEKTPFDCDRAKDCSNPPVFFLLHGFGANTFSFREIKDDLAAIGDVVAYDRPGFGFTERKLSWAGENPYGTKGNEQILSELIANFADGRDVYLVGHSAGGTLAAQFAVDYPAKIKGLILISPAILTSGGGPNWLNGLFYLPQFENLGPLLVSSIASSGMDLLNRSWFDPSLITDEVVAGYRAPLQVKDWERGFWEFNRAPREFDVNKRLVELKLPVLLITGNTDTVVPTKDTEALATQIDSSVLFVIPNSGHLAQEETPAETMKAIRVTWSILSRG